MITFPVDLNDTRTSFNRYVVMYSKVKGSLKGSLKYDTFRMKLKQGEKVVLPNSVFIPHDSSEFGTDFE